MISKKLVFGGDISIQTKDSKTDNHGHGHGVQAMRMFDRLVGFRQDSRLDTLNATLMIAGANFMVETGRFPPRPSISLNKFNPSLPSGFCHGEYLPYEA
ncbi:hypothetical protein AG1IA_07368 [Rhizoctonia solani AG-1 IA]|uniref:Uncharacterized protein n=1 Tax=Thanatephorus cucumeris (strain AG1-IA) TaxID=983506 RepID=L8WKY9_THACA|nr:hypothetical protein AG1IA_07368 [Rhizoctonia solani AG-1 IA]